jgi:hypothetical protein
MSVIEPPSVVAGQNNTGTGEREIEAISYQPLAFSFGHSDVDATATIEDGFPDNGRHKNTVHLVLFRVVQGALQS